MKKKILLILVTVLVVGGIVGIGVSSHIDKVRRERKINDETRVSIANWLVQNYTFTEKVKSLEFTEFTKTTIFGGGGYSSYVRINKDNKRVFQVSVNKMGQVPSKEGVSVMYDSKDLDINKDDKVDKSKSLKNIEIGVWKDK